MIILLIAEARSGSTNLAKWLKKCLPDFELLNEPFNKKSHFNIHHKKIDYSKNIIISEKFFYNKDLIEFLISKSDIVFSLHRENIKEQIESYIIAHYTNNWFDDYDDSFFTNHIIDGMFKKEVDEFLIQKNEFSEFILENNIKSFSYEGLYYQNKISELKDYLNINTDIPFPFGKKYRNSTDKKSIV